LQLLAPGTKKVVLPLIPITEVQLNGHQRYQKHDLKLTVLPRIGGGGGGRQKLLIFIANYMKFQEQYLNLLPTSQPRNVSHTNTVTGDF
jgi:hypothetical protein